MNGFQTGVAKPLFTARFRGGQHEPDAAGRRFLVNSGSVALPITVRTNWRRGVDELAGMSGGK
jgi:hypothetical protein